MSLDSETTQLENNIKLISSFNKDKQVISQLVQERMDHPALKELRKLYPFSLKIENGHLIANFEWDELSRDKNPDYTQSMSQQFIMNCVEIRQNFKRILGKEFKYEEKASAVYATFTVKMVLAEGDQLSLLKALSNTLNSLANYHQAQIEKITSNQIRFTATNSHFKKNALKILEALNFKVHASSMNVPNQIQYHSNNQFQTKIW